MKIPKRVYYYKFYFIMDNMKTHLRKYTKRYKVKCIIFEF